MQAEFLGVEEKDFVNQKTGEKGKEYVLQLHDGKSVKLIRIPVELYQKFRSLQPRSKVLIRFGFADGRFGQHFPVIADLEPAKVAA